MVPSTNGIGFSIGPNPTSVTTSALSTRTHSTMCRTRAGSVGITRAIQRCPRSPIFPARPQNKRVLVVVAATLAVAQLGCHHSQVQTAVLAQDHVNVIQRNRSYV